MLKVEREDFELCDVSGIKVEGRLALGTGEGKEFVIRSEDEAFIIEAIWERSGNGVGKSKIENWMDDKWWFIMFRLQDLQRAFAWVRREILEKKEDLPQKIELSGEDGETKSYMIEMAKLIAYFEEGYWPTINATSCFRDKNHHEIYKAYASIEQMRGLMVSPKGKFTGVSVQVWYKYYLKEDAEGVESKEIISVKETQGSVSGAEAIDYGNKEFIVTPNAEYEFESQGGSVQKGYATFRVLYRKEMHTIELKDGKDSEGNQKYREEKVEEEYKESISVEAKGFGKYESGEGIEKEWELVGAFVHLQVTLIHTEGSSRREYCVSCDCSGGAMKIDQGVVDKVKDLNPTPEGDFVKLEVSMNNGFGLVAKINWNMQIGIVGA